MDKVILSAGYLNQIESNIEKSKGVNKSVLKAKKEQLEKSISKMISEIDSIFTLLAGFKENSAASDLIKERVQVLATKKKELEEELELLTNEQKDTIDTKYAKKIIEERVLEFKRGWKKSNLNLQKKLIRQVFDQLILTDDGINAYYSLDNDQNGIELGPKKLKPSGAIPDGSFSATRKPMGVFMSQGSSVVSSFRETSCQSFFANFETIETILYAFLHRRTLTSAFF